jgi:hypothetical protein
LTPSSVSFAPKLCWHWRISNAASCHPSTYFFLHEVINFLLFSRGRITSHDYLRGYSPPPPISTYSISLHLCLSICLSWRVMSLYRMFQYLVCYFLWNKLLTLRFITFWKYCHVMNMITEGTWIDNLVY